MAGRQNDHFGVAVVLEELAGHVNAAHGLAAGRLVEVHVAQHQVERVCGCLRLVSSHVHSQSFLTGVHYLTCNVASSLELHGDCGGEQGVVVDHQNAVVGSCDRRPFLAHVLILPAP